MNSFTVDYEKSAESELALIWLNAPNPPAVTQASAQIEKLLAQHPVRNGIALSEGLFKLRIPPLAATIQLMQSNAWSSFPTWFPRLEQGNAFGQPIFYTMRTHSAQEYSTSISLRVKLHPWTFINLFENCVNPP